MSPDTPDDTPTDADPASPAADCGQGLVVVRLVVVGLLSVGVLVFGVLAVRDLTAGMGSYAPRPEADTLALDPEQPPEGEANPFGAQNADEALGEHYTPIDHDPAHLPAFPGARRDVCQRLVDGEQYGDEWARYVGAETTVEQVLAHYQRVAEDAGFTPRGAPVPLQQDPGGRRQVFQRGRSLLTVMVSSPTLGPAQPPPARPPVPALSFIVEFRYPIGATP